MIGVPEVQLHEYRGSLHEVEGRAHQWQGIVVLDLNKVDAPVVNARPQGSVLLPDEEEACPSRRGRGPDDFRRERLGQVLSIASLSGLEREKSGCSLLPGRSRQSAPSHRSKGTPRFGCGGTSHPPATETGPPPSFQAQPWVEVVTCVGSQDVGGSGAAETGDSCTAIAGWETVASSSASDPPGACRPGWPGRRCRRDPPADRASAVRPSPPRTRR